MSFLVPITLFGWPLVVLWLFSAMPARRAVIIAYFAAWLFLPETGYKWPMLPAYTKTTAATYGVLLATFIFHPGLLLRFRPRLIDLPVLVFTITPLFSSLTTDRGGYDGISAVIAQVGAWMLPYFVGRLYFTDARGLLELAWGTVLAALAYVPFFLFELKMGPRLHEMVYGFGTLPWFERMRYDGWRPSVFMWHGLMLAMFILMALQTAFWLARTRAVTRLWGYPFWLCVGLLAVLMVLTKSTGAIAIAIIVMAASIAAAVTRQGLILLVLALIPPVYITSRLTGAWDGRNITTWVTENVDEGRAGSYETRREAEDTVVEMIRQRPLFGWTAWQGGGDQLYLVAAKCWGLAGLISLYLIFTIPAVLVIIRVRGGELLNPANAGAIAMAIACLSFLMDSLFNGMYNPVMIVVAGGLSSVAALAPARVTARLSAAASRMAHRRPALH